MKNFILSAMLLLSSLTFAQEKLVTRTGKVSFISKTPVEDIYAKNTQAASILMVKEKVVAFNVLLKSFKFEKALMEEHFNEKYVHSDKYPAAKFKGTIQDDIDFAIPKTHKDVLINGKMIFHGETKSIAIKADLVINEDGSVLLSSKFRLKLKDYKIEVPALVSEKIASEILVTVESNYKKA